MNNEQLVRYARQILLPQIDIDGQERLAGSRVLVAGLGGLGAPVALYLAAAGVGTLVLVDDDAVELSNLQRQIIHTSAAVDTAKVASAAARLLALNPGVEVLTHAERLNSDNAERLAEGADVLVDCSDNFATRYTLNALSRGRGVPLVSGAAIALEGQVTVFDPRQPNSPCYACLYPEQNDVAATCSESGVLGPLVGVVGAMQALETLKLLAGFGTPLVGRVLLFDGAAAEWRSLQLAADPGCPVCAQGTDKGKA